MRRSRAIAWVLWSVAACGRVGFDDPRTAPVDGGQPSALIAPSATFTSECGVAAAPLLFAVVNTGTADLAIESATADGGFTVAAMPDSIEPGQTGTIGILAADAVIGTDRPGDTKSGTLTIVTNAGTHVVALSSTVVGAEIAILDGGGATATMALFASASGACPAPQSFTIDNAGDMPATVVFTSASNVGFGPFSGGTLPGGGSSTIVMAPLTNPDCMIAGQLTYKVTGSVCSATPASFLINIDITGSSGCVCS